MTARYADPLASRSGYKLLTSNGRIEADVLDQLAEELAKGLSESSSQSASGSTPKPCAQAPTKEPTISAPVPKFPDTDLDWEQLRNKNVKIISVQKIDEKAQNAGPSARLEYTKFLLEKNYPELAQKPSAVAGIVVIFDSADGGMVAATMAMLAAMASGHVVRLGALAQMLL